MNQNSFIVINLQGVQELQNTIDYYITGSDDRQSYRLYFPIGILWWEDFQSGSGAWLISKNLTVDEAEDLVGERDLVEDRLSQIVAGMIVVEVAKEKAIEYIQSHVSQHETYSPSLQMWTALQGNSGHRPCPQCHITMDVEMDAESAYCLVCEANVEIPLAM